MIAPEHQVSDDFWDVRSQEKKVKERYQGQIDQLKRVINLGKRTLSLRSQSGFPDFLSAIENLREAETAKLVACFGGNEHMRIIQGKAQALNDILAVLRDTEKSIEGLEARLEAVENELQVVTTAAGKVIPDPLGAKT